jgi:release factor glutamine methyltransferase
MRGWGGLGYTLAMDAGLDKRQRALVALGRTLRNEGYRFITPTPETHRRVNGRSNASEARTLRDVFGWNRSFERSILPGHIRDLADRAGIMVPAADRWLSAVRFATFPHPAGELIFAHSAYPTTTADAVFFGPDSYRFGSFLLRTVSGAQRAVDIGCGAGVGGLVLAPRVPEIVLADINPRALALAAVNVALAGCDSATITTRASDVLNDVEGQFDLAIANPPYLVDDAGRLYRDGGSQIGTDLAWRIVREAMARLTPGGQLVLYSASPVVEGVNVLEERLKPWLRSHAMTWTWEELDPDVFGEELERPAYDRVERIAVVGLSAKVGERLAST